MKKKILFTIGAMLLFCSLAIAQNGGIPVVIKPLNPPAFYVKKTMEESDENAIYNIEIWNDYGLICSEEYDNTTEFMISTNGLMPGIYFMRIYRNSEFLEIQKLIIK